VLLGTAALDSNGNASLTTTLPAGVQILSADYAGDATYSISESSPATVTVNNALINSFTSLATATSQPTILTPVAFTMSVVGNSGTSTPTGNFALTLNGQSLATLAVSADGSASYTATLPAGTDTVVATYGGDAAYLGSASNSVVLTVVPVPDFTIAASPASAQVTAGQPATFQLSLSAQDGFAQAVTFSCFGLPEGASCSFAPSTVTPGTSPVQTTLTIATAASSASARPGHRRGRFWPATGGASALALLLWPTRRRRRIAPLFVLPLVFVLALQLIGCGGSSPTHSTSTVVVTATGGGVTHTINLGLTVTQ
jgi:hypothetical protein